MKNIFHYYYYKFVLVDVQFSDEVTVVVDIIWTECMVQGIVYSVHMHSSHQTTHIFIATFLQTQREHVNTAVNKGSDKQPTNQSVW